MGFVRFLSQNLKNKYDESAISFGQVIANNSIHFDYYTVQKQRIKMLLATDVMYHMRYMD